jgi:uncharacterized protein (TIGR02996 family)
MTREAELLGEILARPDDDAPRFELASLLEKRGDPRGGFIKLQLEVHAYRLEHRGAGDRIWTVKKLIAKHGANWAGEVAKLVTKYEFRRGFVDHVTLDARAFLDRAEMLFSLAPILHIALRDVPADASVLFASPHLARMRSLRLASNRLGDAGCRALAASPYLGNVRWLDLSRNAIGADGLEALCATAGLPSLRFLWFEGNHVDDPTPRPPDFDGNTQVTDVHITQQARDLAARYGPRPWLTDPPDSWPANSDEY